MKRFIITLKWLPVLLLTIASTGCTDNWDDHYEAPVSGDGKTVYEAIAENPDLSVFKQMIDMTEYASILASSQTFTVWAPVNDALKDIDLTDEALVRRTVLNHIARFNHSTSEMGEAGIRMYNGKKMRFENSTFAGVRFVEADHLCANGVLHTMQGVIPYAYNVREYIDSHAETSEIAAFLKRFDEDKFDLENSTPIDVNEKGETVYDSVTIKYNRLLDYPILGLGAIADEDSTFTMVIPTNEAWREAYERIKPWFINNSDSITDVQTSLAVFSDMIFRRHIETPSLFSTLISTTGRKHTDIDLLFGNSRYEAASNGSIWFTDLISQNPLESWNPALEIEAEASITRKMVTSSRSYCTTYNVVADNPFADQISEMSYIYVASSTLGNAGVEFTINNPLSGKYKIYAYFVPAIVDNPSATEETTKVKFSVTHPRGLNTNRTTTVNYTDNSFVTSPTGMTEMYVGEITFPVSNYVDRLRMMNDNYDASANESPFKIVVQANVTQAEFNAGRYARSFRIDRVVLVPVIQ